MKKLFSYFLLFLVFFSIDVFGYEEIEYPVNAYCYSEQIPTNDESNDIFVSIDDAPNFASIVMSAPAYSTIILEDGFYNVSGQSVIRMRNDGVIIKSQSGDRDSVIIDAAYSSSISQIFNVLGDDITIADITIKRAHTHPIHVVGASNTLIHNVKIIDGGEQFIKINPPGDLASFPDNGIIRCSHLELTDEGEPFVRDHGGNIGCYTGGIDAHAADGWQIYDNYFEGIYCKTGALAEHAIHMWRNCKDTVVERNHIVDVSRGIGFGLYPGGGKRDYPDNPEGFDKTTVEHIGGVIRNNVIESSIGNRHDTSIGLEASYNTKVYHNTIYTPNIAYRTIDVRFPASVDVEIKNNLIYPSGISVRNDPENPILENNVELTSALVEGMEEGDFRLKETSTSLIDQGSLTNTISDFNRLLRDETPDIGAFEYGGEIIEDFVYPTINFFSNSTYVINGGYVTLTWTTEDAVECVAKSDWNAPKNFQGEVSIGPLTEESVFILECTGSEEFLKSSESVTVLINQITDPENPTDPEESSEPTTENPSNSNPSRNDDSGVVSEDDVVKYAVNDDLIKDKQFQYSNDGLNCNADFTYGEWTECKNDYTLREVKDNNNCYADTIEKKLCSNIEKDDPLELINDQIIELELNNLTIKDSSSRRAYSIESIPKLEDKFYFKNVEDTEFLLEVEEDESQYLAIKNDDYYTLSKVDNEINSSLETVNISKPSIINDNPRSINYVSIILFLSIIIIGILFYVRNKVKK